jgi:hypothetical protein
VIAPQWWLLGFFLDRTISGIILLIDKAIRGCVSIFAVAKTKMSLYILSVEAEDHYPQPKMPEPQEREMLLSKPLKQLSD